MSRKLLAVNLSKLLGVVNMDRRAFVKIGAGAAGLMALAGNAVGQERSAEMSATTLQITLTAIMVDDQDKAEKFYTEKLGFVLKQNIPMGPVRYITFVSPDAPDSTQLSLEPAGFPFAKTFQKELYDHGVPATAFQVTDLEKTYTLLTSRGVVFTTKPTMMMNVLNAVFDDTCGNKIMLFQA